MLYPHATIDASLKAMRSILKSESMLELFISKQIKEFSNLRKKFPEINRDEVLKVSFLNAAVKLKADAKSEKYCLSFVKKMKATPQLDWLKVHKSFVISLHINEASLREIERAILYRFQHKISHSQIAKFIKMELKDV